MIIRVPDNLEGMNLGQLVALGHCYELNLSKSSDVEKLDYWYSILLNISERSVQMLTPETFNKIHIQVERLLATVIYEYSLLRGLKEKINVFECSCATSEELDAIKLQKEHSNFYQKWFIKTPKTKIFYIGDISKEPYHIWMKHLDGTAKRLSDIKDGEVWKEWKELPKLIASVAWRKGQDRFTDSLNGYRRLNQELINDKAEWFMQMPAVTAIKAFNFFLPILINTSRENSLSRSSILQNLKNLNQVNGGKTLTKNGVGLAT